MMRISDSSSVHPDQKFRLLEKNIALIIIIPLIKLPHINHPSQHWYQAATLNKKGKSGQLYIYIGHFLI
jgi:hypothetical protein